MNHLPERLRAVGEHERHFSLGGDAAELGFAARVEQHGADAVAKRRAAGLPQRGYIVAFCGEGRGEAA